MHATLQIFNVHNMNTITVLLAKIKTGDNQARAELLQLVYDDLRKRANARLCRERSDITFSATELVHEIYMKLFPGSQVRQGSMPTFENSRYFYGAVARAMEQVLIDHARKRDSQKNNGGKKPEPINPNIAGKSAVDNVDYELLRNALDDLRKERPEHAEIVDLHHFLNFQIRAIALMLDLSESTVEKRWWFAKAWLARHISRSDPSFRRRSADGPDSQPNVPPA